MTVEIRNEIINLKNVLTLRRQESEIRITFIGGHVERYRLPNINIAKKVEDEIVAGPERM